MVLISLKNQAFLCVGGKFRKCVSEATGERLPADQYPNRTVCELHKKLYKNVSWDNSKINFDNVPNGFLALLQVVSCMSKDSTHLVI